MVIRLEKTALDNELPIMKLGATLQEFRGINVYTLQRATRMVQLPATAAIEYVAACCRTRTRTRTKTGTKTKIGTITKTVLGA